MSEVGDIAALLTSMSDEDLLAVVLAATTGRPRLDPLRVVAAELAGRSGDIIVAEIVSSDTDSPPGVADRPASAPFGQVGTVPGIPVSPGTSLPGGYTSGGVPTFESVRDKVEKRFGTAQGMGELDSQIPAGQSVDKQWEAREKAARDRLNQIRESMRRNDSG